MRELLRNEDTRCAHVCTVAPCADVGGSALDDLRFSMSGRADAHTATASAQRRRHLNLTGCFHASGIGHSRREECARAEQTSNVLTCPEDQGLEVLMFKQRVAMAIYRFGQQFGLEFQQTLCECRTRCVC